MTKTATILKASDLRIGNLVLDQNTPRKYGPADFTFTMDDISPIPLSPEILNKLGNGDFEPDTFDIAEVYWYDLSKHEFGSWLIDNGEPIAKNIIYLHQLQNLYHALTGQELELDLQPK